MNRVFLPPATLLILALANAPLASAGWVTFTESGVVDGSLGASNFSNCLVSFTVTADTSNIIRPLTPGFFALVDATAEVTVEGIGTGSISGESDVFANAFNQVGFGDAQFNLVYFSTTSPALGGYDLDGSIGPATGSFASGGRYIETGLGELRITTDAYTTTTFTATAAPEPSSLALCGIAGLVGLAIARSRRGRVA